MAELPEHIAIRMVAALRARPRDERLGEAMDAARLIYRSVVAAEQRTDIDALELLAEFLLARDEFTRQKQKREIMLDAQAAVRGAVSSAERALREALQKANTFADRLVE